MLFLPGEVESAFTRHVVQRMWLDPVQELLRHSLRGNQVVPAPGHVALGIELQDAGGQGVAAAKNVEQPAVKPDRKSTRLNSSHGYISYAVFCLKKKKMHSSVDA